jgi:hypothetical protein
MHGKLLAHSRFSSAGTLIRLQIVFQDTRGRIRCDPVKTYFDCFLNAEVMTIPLEALYGVCWGLMVTRSMDSSRKNNTITVSGY